MMEGVSPQARPYIIGARVMIVGLLLAVFALVARASRGWDTDAIVEWVVRRSTGG